MLSSVVVWGVSQLLYALTFMGGVEMGDGSDGSGDSGLYCSLLSHVCVTIAIVFRMLKGLGGRFKSFRQAWGNNRELLSKSIWHRRLIGIVIYCEDLRFWGCY